MNGLRGGLFAVLACGVWLTACNATVVGSAPTCGQPPPVPVPFLSLIYPEPSATNVPDNVGVLVFQGVANDFFGPDSITLSSGSTTVPAGAFTAPPSPLPTPHATPSGIPASFVAVPVPTLSPATTYNVTFNYTDFGESNPPSCTMMQTQNLGSFTTK